MRDPVRGEALTFGLVFAGAYAVLALLFHGAPRLFVHLDQVFDADLGLWTIDLARPQGPHGRTLVHPLAVLFFNPLGSALRWLLQAAGVGFAARLSASLLCAAGGGAAVGAFRLLLHRLGVAPARARAWALVFALSASQVVFSALPESFVFSALGLVVVYTVAANPGAREWSRVAAGVFAFGVTVTNLGAVALARSAGLSWRESTRRAAAVVGRHVVLVLLLAAALSLVQVAVYPTAHVFFRPEPLGSAYRLAVEGLPSPGAVARRGLEVASHLGFVCLAAPRVTVRVTDESGTKVDFPPRPWRALRPAGGVHAVLWGLLLLGGAHGVRGALAAGNDRRRGILAALVGWLVLQAALHLVFGTSLFLYSAHWTFAVVVLTAVGVESTLRSSGKRAGLLMVALCAVVVLQALANAALVADILRLFAGRG